MRKWLVGVIFWLVVFVITLMGLGLPLPWHLGLATVDIAAFSAAAHAFRS